MFHKHSLLKMHLSLYYTIQTFSDPVDEAFGKILEKGENAGKQHFLLFPQCFLLYHREKSSFWQYLNCHLHMLSKILLFGKKSNFLFSEHMSISHSFKFCSSDANL